tara:strand:+ start:206 stop:823 length:618 start_codon:yes stop_codon:yes gene_type:complete
MIKKITLFSSLLQTAKLDNTKLNTQLIKYATSLKKKTKSAHISNEGGFQSQPLSIKDTPLLKKFISNIKTAMENYISSYQLVDPYEARISALWFNINSKHHYNKTHIHPGCQFVGSYYIQTSKNCGRLVMENPVPSHQMDEFYGNKFTIYNQYTSNVFFHDPQAGELVLFPAWIPHYAEPNRSGKDRISISFNIDVQTTIKKEAK